MPLYFLGKLKMDKLQFAEFIKDNILSIFTGSEIIGEEPSTSRDSLVAQGSSGSLLVKFNKNDDYRYQIKRIQPFKNYEAALVKSIITELGALKESSLDNSYFKTLQSFVIERAICKSVSESSYETLLEIVTQLNKWSKRTYEGSSTTFGFMVCNIKAGSKLNQNLHISKILQENFSAVLADGINTCYKISSDGYLLTYVTLPDSKDQTLNAPYEYMDMANICYGSRVGISLTANGDILLFHDKNLVYAKRGGTWTRYSHEEIIDRISAGTNEEADKTRQAIYLSALDVSFARTGGCVVHLDKSSEGLFLKHINSSDLLLPAYYDIKYDQEHDLTTIDAENMPEKTSYADFLTQSTSSKISNLRCMINGRKFYELSRKLRQELLSVDGATVIDNDGDIVAVGAIIMIESGSFSGGRLAAAKTLSRYGVSIKISEDGQIQGFKLDKHKTKSIPIFMLG